MSLRSAWSIDQASGHSGLYSETHSKTNNFYHKYILKNDFTASSIFAMLINCSEISFIHNYFFVNSTVFYSLSCPGLCFPSGLLLMIKPVAAR